MAAREPVRPPSGEARTDLSRDTVVPLVDALGPISPELVLVDPRLAARARALLPDPVEHVPLRPSRAELPVLLPELEHEPASTRRTSARRALVAAGAVGLLVAIGGVGVWRGIDGARDVPPRATATDETTLFSAPPTDPSLTPEAIATLESRARRQPRSAAAREALGTAYLRLRRWADAEPQLRALVALVPNDAYAHFALGRALEEQGKRSEAARHQARAEALSGG